MRHIVHIHGDVGSREKPSLVQGLARYALQLANTMYRLEVSQRALQSLEPVELSIPPLAEDGVRAVVAAIERLPPPAYKRCVECCGRHEMLGRHSHSCHDRWSGTLRSALNMRQG